MLDEDPDLDPIVWFEAEALAAASTIEIGSHGLEIAALQIAPLAEQIAGEITAPGLSLAQLPGWPGAPASGQGWGARLDAAIGLLRPGFTAVIGGARGAGRTSWLSQLADGLALREGSLLTPVIVMSDDPPRVWRARSLGRYAGIDPRRFLGHRDPSGARTDDALADELATGLRGLAGEWRALAQRQRFTTLARLGMLDELDELAMALERWRAELSAADPSVQVWPVVIVDALDAGARLAALAELAAQHHAIVLAAADDAGFGRAQDRHLDLRIRLHPLDDALEVELAYQRLGPRERVRLGWTRSCGRFEPDAPDPT